MRIARWAWLIVVGLQIGWVQAQTISGRLTDAETGEPLFAATVQLIGKSQGTVSNSDGYFEISLATSGVYGIQVNFIGYQELVVPEIWLKNKETVHLNLTLNLAPNNLDELVITEVREVSSPGRLIITEEQINRFAATYYDPARMATSVADVAVTNDQNNRISVRGISPNYNTWRLEGAEILNPNHLSNAGTFSDQPTATGGGVNMLSTQMMGSSAFLFGSMGAGQSNTVGGLFDMQMKTGNGQSRQYVAQASLIGFDFAADGPLLKNGATFAVNYRYSFTGLLTSFGVDFGGESIGFQDLSFSLHFPIGKQTRLKIFGLGGLNFNEFAAPPLAEVEVEKDLYNIDFYGKMGAFGASLESSLGEFEIKNTIVGSAVANERTQTEASSGAYSAFDYQHYLLSNHFKINRSFEKLDLESGFLLNAYSFETQSSTLFITPIIQLSRSFSNPFERILLSPYAQTTVPLGNRMSLALGANYPMLSGLGSRLDVRGSLAISTPDRPMVTFSAGQYSQMYQPTNYLFDTDAEVDEVSRSFIRSNRFVIDVDRSRPAGSFQWSLFHYHFPRVQLSDGAEPEASRTGLSVSAERHFSSGFYFRSGLSGYHPRPQGGFQSGHFWVTNLSNSIGRAFELNPQNQLSVNIRGLYQSGLDLAPRVAHYYYRADLRVQWKKTKPKTTRNLSLDIQNVTNRKNPFYTYFDEVQQAVVKQKQLGLIPILTYRIDF